MFSPSAYEVPAVATEVPRVSGGRQGPGGPAGPPGRTDATQIQHGSDPRPQRVFSNVALVS